MRLIIAAALMFAFAAALPARADVIDVLSGDVIKVGDNEWRLANIDAPQIEHTCPGESHLGRIAQAKLAELVAAGDLEILPTGDTDANHRRTAPIKINGQDLGEQMLAARLAQRHGEARSLCPRYATSGQPRRGDLGGTSVPPMPTYGIRGGAGQMH